MNKKYVELLYKLTKKAYQNKEVPVGAIIIKNDKIISKGFNNRQKKHDVTGHAEIVCIKKAAKKLKDWRLNDCELYVSLEPCEMCKKIIEESRIKKVYFLTKSNYNNKQKNTFYSKIDYKNKEFETILNQFFKNKR